MKRKITFTIAALTVLVFLAPVSLNAQEEKEKEVEKKIEKRVMIVTVDESGEKTVIDTIITGDTDLEELHLGKDHKWIKKGDDSFKTIKTKDGNVFIMSADDKSKFSFHASGDNKVISEEGDVFVIKKGEKNIEWVEQSAHLKDGQVHIVIHSANEVEDFVIDGDAVITIKDGKVKINSDGLHTNIKEEGAVKEVKKVKKESKKK